MKKQPNNKKTLTIVSRRSVLEASSRAMFLWVAGASILLVTVAVVMVYVFKQLQFNETVIKHETTAVKMLKENASNYNELKKNIDNLAANNALASVRSSQSADNLQSITDALAATSDASTFAASLQNIIAPRSGVSLESVNIPSAEDLDQSGPSDTMSVKPTELEYQIDALGSYQSITAFLDNLELTIRPASVSMIQLTGTDNMLRARISLVTYYQPIKDFNITQKEISQR